MSARSADGSTIRMSEVTNGAMQVEFEHFDHLLIESRQPNKIVAKRFYLQMDWVSGVVKAVMFTLTLMESYGRKQRSKEVRTIP